LPAFDPVLAIKRYVVSTPIKNTVIIGYFAKIPLIIGILACVFSSVIFSAIFATSNLSYEETIARQMPSMARQIDYVGENGEFGREEHSKPDPVYPHEPFGKSR